MKTLTPRDFSNAELILFLNFLDFLLFSNNYACHMAHGITYLQTTFIQNSTNSKTKTKRK